MHKVLLNNKYTLVFFAVFLIVLKFIFIFSSGPLPDEAYYWLWSKNIDLSYYDHPPLTSWIQYLISFIVPDNILEIRALPFLCFLIICFINIKWMMEIKKRENIELPNSTVIFLSMPIYGILLTIAFPDALMVLLLFLSGFLFYKFYSARIEKKKSTNFGICLLFFFSSLV